MNRFTKLKPSCSLDKKKVRMYNPNTMKKVVFLFLILAGLFAPVSISAEEIICPQPYGGGVVCGVKTHEPVETGLGENLALVGALALGASGILLFVSRKNLFKLS